MKAILNITTAALLAAIPLSASALAIPKGSSKDPRIQTVTYHPDDVVQIRSKVGDAVLVQLEADESISGENALLGSGDSGAWKLAVRGNNIIFKPSAPSPATNMLIATNKRTYAFSLVLAGKKQQPTYILRFRYPDSVSEKNRLEAERQAKALDRLRRIGGSRKVTQNTNYWAYGSKELAPTAAYDNGRFTYLSFDNGRELPLIYKVMEDGTEALLNTHQEGDTVVIHETAAKFHLRLGKRVLAVENRSYNPNGMFNRTGTDSDTSVRLSRNGKDN